jgi:hypothetical protein
VARFRVLLDGRPAGEGTLALGLRAASAPHQPWRWLSLPTDPLGRAALPNLKPGRYQACLRWFPELPDGQPASRPLPPAGQWLHDRAEFTATPGKPLDLPALEWRTTR